MSTTSLDIGSLTSSLNPIKGTPVSLLNIVSMLGLGLAFLLVTADHVKCYEARRLDSLGTDRMQAPELAAGTLAI